MNSELRKQIFERIKIIFEELDLKYKTIGLEEEEDFLGVELSFKEEEITTEIIIYIGDKPFRLNLFIPDLFPINSFLKDKEIKIVKIINEMNTQKVLYGNLGYSFDTSSVVYSNSISLAGRNTIEVDELNDYLMYSVFLSQKVHEEINSNLYKESVKLT